MVECALTCANGVVNRRAVGDWSGCSPAHSGQADVEQTPGVKTRHDEAHGVGFGHMQRVPWEPFKLEVIVVAFSGSVPHDLHRADRAGIFNGQRRGGLGNWKEIKRSFEEKGDGQKFVNTLMF